MTIQESLETGSQTWWAMTGSNCRPSRCKRLSNQYVIDLSTPGIVEMSAFYIKVRKTAQEIMRMLRLLALPSGQADTWAGRLTK